MSLTSAYRQMIADAQVFSVYVPLGYADRQHTRLGLYRSWATVVRILKASNAAYATVDGVIVARSAN